MPRFFASKVVAGSALIAVMTKTLSPQTTGLACERPGMGVFHRTLFCDLAASHRVGVRRPSETPEALAPRNWGQFCARAASVSVRSMSGSVISLLRLIGHPPFGLCKANGI